MLILGSRLDLCSEDDYRNRCDILEVMDGLSGAVVPR